MWETAILCVCVVLSLSFLCLLLEDRKKSGQERLPSLLELGIVGNCVIHGAILTSNVMQEIQ